MTYNFLTIKILLLCCIPEFIAGFVVCNIDTKFIGIVVLGLTVFSIYISLMLQHLVGKYEYTDFSVIKLDDFDMSDETNKNFVEAFLKFKEKHK